MPFGMVVKSNMGGSCCNDALKPTVVGSNSHCWRLPFLVVPTIYFAEVKIHKGYRLKPGASSLIQIRLPMVIAIFILLSNDIFDVLLSLTSSLRCCFSIVEQSIPA